MILQAFTQYYEDLVKQDKIARPGWAMQKVSYALCIGESGELEQVVPLLEETEGKKPQPQRLSLPAPVKRTAGIAPNFLWDNSSYLLGMDAKGKPERSIKCFEACRDYHHALLDGVESAAAKSILRFFDSWVPKNTNTHPALLSDIDAIMAGSNLVFRVNGSYAHEDELIQKAWQNSYDRTEGELQQCLVTGQKDLIEAVHPSIKGVDGAQSSGAAIVSFNAPAFCSYGQEQNYNAPVGKYAAFAYTSALNHLLADRENVQKIGDTTVVCWASFRQAGSRLQRSRSAGRHPEACRRQTGSGAEAGAVASVLHPWVVSQCSTSLRAFLLPGYLREPNEERERPS